MKTKKKNYSRVSLVARRFCIEDGLETLANHFHIQSEIYKYTNHVTHYTARQLIKQQLDKNYGSTI